MSEWPAPEFESKICPPEKLAERLAALPVRWCLPTAVSIFSIGVM